MICLWDWSLYIKPICLVQLRERERERALNMYSNCFLMAICLIINKDGFVAHVTTLKCNVILKIWQRLGLNTSMYWIHRNYNICLPLVICHNLDEFSAPEPIPSKHVNFTSEWGLPNMRGTFHETDLKRCFLLVSPKFC